MKLQAHNFIKEGSLATKRYFLNIRQTPKGERFNKKRIDFAL